MRNKEAILREYKKKFKPTFLLAWARFLTYDELEKTDNLEAYDAALNSGIVKTPAEWNKLVIPYVEDNIKKALCIELNRAANDITQQSGLMSSIYSNDIVAWLYILNDDSAEKPKTIDEIKSFYNNVSKKYKFEIFV